LYKENVIANIVKPISFTKTSLFGSTTWTELKKYIITSV